MEAIQRHLAEVRHTMTLLNQGEIERVVDVIRIVKKTGGTMYLFGNGGSHATASHFANDLMKMVRVRALCIGDLSTTLLAYGNDNGWENMFLSPLSEMLNPNDGVMGISCSGESENVLRALEHAVGREELAVGLTGQSDGSRINKLRLDALVHVRADDIRVQEDIHLMVCHAIVRSLQEEQ